MAAAVAGEVLGPRPGKAACSFSKGVVEIVLRSCSAVSRKVHTATASETSINGIANFFVCPVFFKKKSYSAQGF